MPKLKNPPTPTPPIVAAPISKILFSVEDAAIALSMGRTSIFALIRSGDIHAVKIGKRRLVAASELEAFALRLQEAV
jgi:excisionase family DNA binding protein